MERSISLATTRKPPAAKRKEKISKALLGHVSPQTIFCIRRYYRSNALNIGGIRLHGVLKPPVIYDKEPFHASPLNAEEYIRELLSSNERRIQ